MGSVRLSKSQVGCIFYDFRRDARRLMSLFGYWPVRCSTTRAHLEAEGSVARFGAEQSYIVPTEHRHRTKLWVCHRAIRHTLLIDRNCHKSLAHLLMMDDVVPVSLKTNA
ncbi:hypothetical protein ACNKHW_01245 [Shigella flexneri]